MNSGFGAQAYGGPTGSKNGMNATGSMSSGRMPKDKIPKGYRKGELQNFSPEMMKLFQSLFPHLSEDSDLSQLASGDESSFDDMEAPALRQFNELLGGLASRFSGQGGQGSLGARRSSGFQNATTSAASNFAQELQSQRQGLTRQALNDLMSHSNTLLGQKPTEKLLTEKPKKWWEAPTSGIASGFGQAAGKAIGNLF